MLMTFSLLDLSKGMSPFSFKIITSQHELMFLCLFIKEKEKQFSIQSVKYTILILFYGYLFKSIIYSRHVNNNILSYLINTYLFWSYFIGLPFIFNYLQVFAYLKHRYFRLYSCGTVPHLTITVLWGRF